MYRPALILTIDAGVMLVAPAPDAAHASVSGCRASQWHSNTAEHKTTVSIFDGKQAVPVQVDCDDQQFFADHVEVYKGEGLVKATGNIIYAQGGNRIVAER